MVIQGSVLDQSPGAPNTPAIADNDMTQWMEYIYTATKPDAVGVPVSIDAIDPNNNNVHSRHKRARHFAYTWTLQYTRAIHNNSTLLGSKSYFGSSSETTAYFRSSTNTNSSPSCSSTTN
jgi:hypothetical protein